VAAQRGTGRDCFDDLLSVDATPTDAAAAAARPLIPQPLHAAAY